MPFMESNKKVVLIIILVIVLYYVIYWGFHVSSPQLSNFNGNAEAFRFDGKNSDIQFKANKIFLTLTNTTDFNFYSVKNITIENNKGEKRLINHSNGIYIRNYNRRLMLISDVYIGLHFVNLTLTKTLYDTYFDGIITSNYTATNGGNVEIDNSSIDDISIGDEKVTDFNHIIFELDKEGYISFSSEISKLQTTPVYDLNINGQLSKMTILNQGAGILNLDNHKFEIKSADVLYVESPLNYKNQPFLAVKDNEIIFNGDMNSAKLNNEDIILSEGFYWYKIKPEALFSGINAIAVVILVIITGWYANEVKKQTELTLKDKMRPRILEVIEDVLTPSMHSLEKEIKAIQSSKIQWYHHKSGRTYFSEGISKLLSDDINGSAAFRDLIQKFPDIEKNFQSHDTLYNKLNDLYAKVEGEVKTPEFIEHLKFLKNEFNKSRDETHRLRGVFLDEPDHVFVYFIVNFRNQREQSEDTLQPELDFWEEYKDKLLLKFRNTPRIKQFDIEIDDSLMQLKNLNEDFFRRMEEIREDYRKEYHFTKYEIDPEQKNNW